MNKDKENKNESIFAEIFFWKIGENSGKPPEFSVLRCFKNKLIKKFVVAFCSCFCVCVCADQGQFCPAGCVTVVLSSSLVGSSLARSSLVGSGPVCTLHVGSGPVRSYSSRRKKFFLFFFFFCYFALSAACTCACVCWVAARVRAFV